MRNALLGSGLFAAILLNGAAFASAAPACAAAPPALGKYTPTAEAKAIPAATFLDAQGDEKSLADSRGKGLVVNFWATWCAPCVKEMPALDRLSAGLGDDDIKVLALSADRGGAPVVKEFYAKNGIRNLPVMIDAKGAVARALAVPGLPTT